MTPAGRERGAAGVVLLGIMVVTLLLVAVVADVGAYLTARARATVAADAASLAAAPVTFRPFGATAGARSEALRFAASNGARLISCRCPQDPSFDARVVHVEVEVPVRTILFGRLEVRAASRAEFRPVQSQPIGGP